MSALDQKRFDFTRNIGISAHIDSGKTTLTERILFYSGRTHKIEEVKGGGDGAVMDHMELEKERGITITSAATQVQWQVAKKGPMYTVNVIDTPGHVDFTVEVERSLRVLDGAILVLCSVGGVQSQSLTVDRQMKRYGTPRIAFINKMDRTGANPDSVIQQIEEKLGVNPVPIQMNIGAGVDFEGVIDLINMRKVDFEGDQGIDVVYSDVPAEHLEKAEARRAEMLEALSMFDDNLMETLLEEGEVDAADIRRIVREATLGHKIVPVMMGSAFKNKGVQELLDAVTYYLPKPTDREITAIDKLATEKAIKADEIKSDEVVRVPLKHSDSEPLVAMAFKTVMEQFGQLTYTRIYQGTIVKGDSYINTRTGQKVRFGRVVRMHSNDREDVDVAGAGDIVAVVGIDCASGDTFCGDGLDLSLENIFVPEPVIKLSIEPANREGAANLSKALERFRREDPTFQLSTDEETGETLIAGMGQLHLDVYIERIKREYKVECTIGEPRVAYRETPSKSVEFNHKHKKQTGGSGQFAHIVGRLDPIPEEEMDAPYEFVNDISQGRIPKEYIPSIDHGFQESISKGPLAECEVVGVRMTVSDGSFHDVDSSEMAFKTAGKQCMRESLKKAAMVLLEPIMKLEIEAPDEFQGSITGHLSSKRGVISNTETKEGNCVILGEVPLANMFDYANELRSMTQGKGGFSMEFAKYARCPKNIQEEIVEIRQKEREQKLANK